MTEQHPITPPPELVQQWMRVNNMDIAPLHLAQMLATQAARWGADQELNECCHLLRLQGFDVVDDLRAARRPKPPTLKEQALSDFDGLMSELDGAGNYSNCAERIRRALEQLDD